MASNFLAGYSENKLLNQIYKSGNYALIYSWISQILII